MNAITEVLITKVVEKLSQRGEKYYSIDATEDTGIKNSTGGNFLRVWSDVYMPHTEGMENPKSLEGYKVKAVFNFYPVMRTVGYKNFTDIKVNLVKFN